MVFFVEEFHMEGMIGVTKSEATLLQLWCSSGPRQTSVLGKTMNESGWGAPVVGDPTGRTGTHRQSHTPESRRLDLRTFGRDEVVRPRHCLWGVLANGVEPGSNQASSSTCQNTRKYGGPSCGSQPWLHIRLAWGILKVSMAGLCPRLMKRALGLGFSIFSRCYSMSQGWKPGEEREKLKGRARKPSGDAECEKLYGTNDPRLTTQLCRSGEKVGTWET